MQLLKQNKIQLYDLTSKFTIHTKWTKKYSQYNYCIKPCFLYNELVHRMWTERQTGCGQRDSEERSWREIPKNVTMVHSNQKGQFFFYFGTCWNYTVRKGASVITHALGWMAGTAGDEIGNVGEASANVTSGNHKWRGGWLWEQSVSDERSIYHWHNLEMPACDDSEKKISFIWFYLFFMRPVIRILHRHLHQKGPVPTAILHPQHDKVRRRGIL